MNLGSAGSVSVTSSACAVAPPPPPPLSSSGGGSGPSSLSPGTLGGYQPQPPSLAPHTQLSGVAGVGGPGPSPGVPPPLASQGSVTSQQPDFRYSGTELVMLYDYKVSTLRLSCCPCHLTTSCPGPGSGRSQREERRLGVRGPQQPDGGRLAVGLRPQDEEVWVHPQGVRPAPGHDQLIVRSGHWWSVENVEL